SARVSSTSRDSGYKRNRSIESKRKSCATAPARSEEDPAPERSRSLPKSCAASTSGCRSSLLEEGGQDLPEVVLPFVGFDIDDGQVEVKQDRLDRHLEDHTPAYFRGSLFYPRDAAFDHFTATAQDGIWRSPVQSLHNPPLSAPEFSPDGEDFSTKTHEELLSLVCWPGQRKCLEFLIFLCLPESRKGI